MSSLFRDLSRAAIEADLGKNAFKVFNTLLEQTLGYGKSTDRLTDRRLASLSQVRLDRFRPALHDVLEHALFEQRPAKKFQYRYTIGKTFLEKNGDKDFFTPALPKNRADFQKTDDISEKERHTALDLNPSLSSLLQPLQTLLSFSTEMLQQQMQQQAQFMQTLLQAQQSTAVKPEISGGVSITYPKPSTAPAPSVSVVNIRVSESQLGNITLNKSDHQANKVFSKTDQKTDSTSEKQSIESIKSVSGDKNNHLTAEQQDSPTVSHDPVSLDQQQLQQASTVQPKSQVLALPKAIAALIPASDHTECQTLLATLSMQQQKNTFVVYQDMLDQDRIHHPMPLFSKLVEKAQHNALVLPKSVTEAHIPLHPSMIIETHEDRLARQDAEDDADNEARRQMLRHEAKQQGISVEEVAKKMRLTYLLPL